MTLSTHVFLFNIHVGPNPEKHVGYRNILLQNGRIQQVEEETKLAKNPIASEMAVKRAAEVQKLKQVKAEEREKNKKERLQSLKYDIYFLNIFFY